MTLLRASLITSTATLIRMAAGLVLNKVFAIYLGPTGLAQLAQLGTLAGIAGGVATGGVNSGITRYVAEHGDAQRSAPIVTTALAVGAAAASAAALLLVAFSGAIAAQVFGDSGQAWAIWILAAANFLVALNALAIAILNGRKRIGAIALIGIAGSLLSLASGLWLTLRYSLPGAIVAACIAPALPTLATAAYFAVRRASERVLFAPRPDRASLALLGRYAAMALTAAIAGPASVLLVRDRIAAQFSWEGAGHWQGVWKISEVYLTLVTSSLAVYFLPRLAELRDPAQLRGEIRAALLTAMPLVAGAAFAIYVLRDWLTVTLFSAAFLPMTGLFAFQLLGDVAKIAGWLFAYLMLARAMTAPYIGTEIAFSASFFGLSVLFVHAFGLVGVTYAHALNYLAYLVTVWYLTRPLLRTS